MSLAIKAENVPTIGGQTNVFLAIEFSCNTSSWQCCHFCIA